MKKKALLTVFALMALEVYSDSSTPALHAQTATDSITCVVNKDGIEVTVTAAYPTDDAKLQKALASYMRSMMPAKFPESATADGQALLAACADAAWTYMSAPQMIGNEEGIDIILGEGASEECSEFPSAEELAEYDGGFPRSTYTAEFPMVYDSAGYVTWQCSWNLYAEGTPHPAYGITGATFRKSDGRLMSHDILRDTDSKGFRKLLKETLRKWLADEWEWKDATDQQIEEILQEGISLNALPMPVNAPYLLPEGVALPYQEWELTGSRAVQVLVLPYDKIKKYLKIGN